MTQVVKNPPAMRETLVRFLGQEESTEEGNGYPLQYSGLENSMDCIVHGVKKSWARLSDFHFTLYRWGNWVIARDGNLCKATWLLSNWARISARSPDSQSLQNIDTIYWASLVAQMVKNLPAMQETCVQSLGQEDSPGEGNDNPLQYSCLENPRDRGAW